MTLSRSQALEHPLPHCCCPTVTSIQPVLQIHLQTHVRANDTGPLGQQANWQQDQCLSPNMSVSAAMWLLPNSIQQASQTRLQLHDSAIGTGLQ